jgi:hypothetical protein
MIPVLTETFEAQFNGTKRPTYIKVGEEWLRNESVIGIITSDWTGSIPPTTICEQLNDLRVDIRANKVTTYLFVDIAADSLLAQVPDVTN